MPCVASVYAPMDWPIMCTIQSVVLPFAISVFSAQAAVHMMLLRAS